MQLGKKSKTTDMFERVRGDLGAQAEDSTPLVPAAQPQAAPQKPASGRASLDREAIQVTVSEKISAKISREGSLTSFGVQGFLQFRTTDPSLTKVKLDVLANATHGAQFRTHPRIDKGLFNSSKIIQLSDTSRGFPINNSIEVLRWSASPSLDSTGTLPISFTVWVNKGSDKYNVTIEYELTGGDDLRDVVMTMPFSTGEPEVSSYDAVYEVSGDSLEWTIGPVDESKSSGSFEFEAQADDESDFFPMKVGFAKTKPFVEVDVCIEPLPVVGRTLIRAGPRCYTAGHESRDGFHEGYQISSRQLLDRINSSRADHSKMFLMLEIVTQRPRLDYLIT